MTTEEFLFALFGGVERGALEILARAEKGTALKPARIVLWKPLPLEPFTFAGSHAERLNQRGYGVHFGCAVRDHIKGEEWRVDPDTKKSYLMKHPRGGEKDAVSIPFIWADIDQKDGGTLENAKLLPFAPTITVFSGGGWHLYYKLNPPYPITADNLSDVKRTIKGVAKFCGMDSQIADLARTMRLPGTVNPKPERNGARCEVLTADLSVRYTFDQFAPYAYYGGSREPEYPITRPLPEHTDTAPLPRWVGRYLASGAPDGERNHTLFRAACAYAESGRDYHEAERDLATRGEQDGLEPHEVVTTIKSAYRKVGGNVTLPAHMKMRMSNADRKQKGKS